MSKISLIFLLSLKTSTFTSNKKNTCFTIDNLPTYEAATDLHFLPRYKDAIVLTGDGPLHRGSVYTDLPRQVAFWSYTTMIVYGIFCTLILVILIFLSIQEEEATKRNLMFIGVAIHVVILFVVILSSFIVYGCRE